VVRPAEVDQVLGCVAEWRQLEMAVDSRRRDMVAGLRSRGASWAAIGWLLGTTAEAARLRFRDLVA
jgi:hypothetical protein